MKEGFPPKRKMDKASHKLSMRPEYVSHLGYRNTNFAFIYLSKSRLHYSNTDNKFVKLSTTREALGDPNGL